MKYLLEIDYPQSFGYPQYWSLILVDAESVEIAMEFAMVKWSPMIPLRHHDEFVEVPGEMLDCYLLCQKSKAYFVKRWHRDDLEGPFVW